MAPLAQCQAVEVREMHFDHDVRHLVAGIRSLRPFDLRRLVRENSATVLALAILVASGFVASLFWMRPAFLMTAELYTAGAIDSVDDPQTVQALLDKGADSNAQDRDGWTALMFSAQKGLTGAARVLVQGGADRSKKNKESQTALTLARLKNRKQIVALLGAP
jgi:ankyrin repeat protein